MANGGNQPCTLAHVEAANAEQAKGLNRASWVRTLVMLAGVLLPFFGYELTQRPANAPPPAITLEQVRAMIDAAHGTKAAPLQPPVKVWLPDASGEIGKGKWVSGVVTGEVSK